MLNYMRSETYRLLRNKALWVTSILLVLVELYLFYCFKGSFTVDAMDIFNMILRTLGFLSFFPLMLMMFFAAKEDKEGTIKHSIAYGFSRKKLYLARFLIQALFCTMVYLIMLASASVLALLLVPHQPEDFLFLFRIAALAWPVLISLAAFEFMMLMNLNNNGNALFYGIAWTNVLPTVLSLLAAKYSFLNHVVPRLPLSLLDWNGALFAQGTQALNAPLFGAGYTILFILLGMFFFEKKEIR